MSTPRRTTTDTARMLTDAADALVMGSTEVPSALATELARAFMSAAKYGTPRSMARLEGLAIAVLELLPRDEQQP